jgi:hypothetical protein
MSINTKGEFWIGSEPEDVKAFLEAYTSEGYPIHEFRRCRCACGSEVFKIEASVGDAVARRTCSRCGRVHFMLDSGELWDNTEEEPELLECVECGSTEANVGVGFSLYQEGEVSGEIHWVYIGHRCAACGLLGSFADWKVARVGAHDLFDRV